MQPSQIALASLILHRCMPAVNLLHGERIDEAVLPLPRQAPSQLDILLRCEPPMILDYFFTATSHFYDIPGDTFVASVKALVKYAAAAAADLGWPHGTHCD